MASFDDVVASLSPTHEPDVINSGLKSVLGWVKQVKTDVDMEKVEKTLPTSLKLDDPSKASSDSLSKWFTTCFEQIDKASKSLNI